MVLSLLLTGLAYADCPAETPTLTLGDQSWFVEGGSWEAQIADVAFSSGFAFSVEHDGTEVGTVFVGAAEHRIHAGDAGPALEVAISREIAKNADIDVRGTWRVPVDLAWRLGSVADPPEDWTRIEIDDRVVLDLDAPVQPTLLVVDYRDLLQARRTATLAVADRARALADGGYPLRTTLDTVGASSTWALLEARTPWPLGGLAGRAGGSADPWVTTLIDDPMLGAGRRVASVALGTRYVEGLSGC